LTGALQVCLEYYGAVQVHKEWIWQTGEELVWVLGVMFIYLHTVFNRCENTSHVMLTAFLSATSTVKASRDRLPARPDCCRYRVHELEHLLGKVWCTKLAMLKGNPSIMTASSTPISTPSSRAFVATIPRRLPPNASRSILRRSYIFGQNDIDVSGCNSPPESILLTDMDQYTGKELGSR
jgi:hypothetical protein